MWGIKLQRSSDVSLKRQIYVALREQIIRGNLKAGESLPSSRQLALELQVSRNTIMEAFEMLNVEGYIVSRVGAPTRVAEGLMLDTRTESKTSPEIGNTPEYIADFRTGLPDLRLFPRYAWQRVTIKALSELSPSLLGYTGPQGMPALRKEIASWLHRSKGLVVDAQDIFITAGATHALHIVAELLYQDAQNIYFEDPCNIEMLKTFINKGFNISHIPVD